MAAATKTTIQTASKLMATMYGVLLKSSSLLGSGFGGFFTKRKETDSNNF